MSFHDREVSTSDGAPVELYDFYRGTLHWRYTNADRDIVYDGLLFRAIPISRNEIEQSSEVKKLGLTIKAPMTIEIYEQFRVAPPGSAIGCIVYTYQAGGAVGDVIPEWTGRVITCVRKGIQVELVCEPMYISLMAMGIRRRWQKSCPHLLYGPGCKVNKTQFVVPAVVQDVQGLWVTVPAAISKPDYYFEGGYIEWTDFFGLPDYRGIEEHVGDKIRLSYGFDGIVSGTAVSIYPGCAHTMQMCKDRFNNLLNYGGTPYIPQKNPYKGNPVY